MSEKINPHYNEITPVYTIKPSKTRPLPHQLCWKTEKKQPHI